jgi:hypothetical protein
VARKYVFADESGDMTFKRGANISRFFIITTVVLDDLGICEALLGLRREMAWDGQGHLAELHATENEQAVRDEVFKLLGKHRFRIDATILDKPKAQPKIRPSTMRFYKYAWFYHLKALAPSIAGKRDELHLIVSSFFERRRRKEYHAEVHDALAQTSPTVKYQVACWETASEPGLVVADYCSWAMFKKWERGDKRSYDLIKPKIGTEYNLFAGGPKNYY